MTLSYDPTVAVEHLRTATTLAKVMRARAVYPEAATGDDAVRSAAPSHRRAAALGQGGY